MLVAASSMMIENTPYGWRPELVYFWRVDSYPETAPGGLKAP